MSESAETVEGGESACWLDRVCPECGRLGDRPVVERYHTCEEGDGEAPPAG